MNWIKTFFNWKAKINRKTFLVRFFNLILLAFLLLIVSFIIPIPLISLALSFGIFYALLCTLYQYIKSVDSKNTLITYFTWIIFYFILTKYVFPSAIGLFFWYNVPGMEGLALLLPPFIFIIPLLLLFISILSAWLLSTKIALFVIQKIVGLLVGIWKKISSTFGEK